MKYKKLVDGGIMKIVNNTVPDALERLGYEDDEIADIINYMEVSVVFCDDQERNNFV